MSADKTPSLRLRLARAGAALAVAVLLAGGAWYGYAALLSQPVARVAFSGDADRLARADLEAFAAGLRGAAAPTPSQVREAARRIPGVRDASVRRRFPDAVEVAFEAHVPLARWGDHAMLSRLGEVYTGAVDASLPRLRGPEAAAARMAAELPGIARALEPLGSPLAELRLSPRGAWEARLASGLTIALGRQDVRARLDRFAALWPAVAARAPAATVADLRYGNGFAMRTPAKGPQQGRT